MRTLLMKLLKNFIPFSKTKRKKIQAIKELLTKYSSSINEVGMVEAILEIQDFVSRDIMIPRIDISALEVNTNKKEIQQFLRTQHYSRIPVYEKNIDNIIGTLHVKDVFRLLIDHPKSTKIDLKKIVTSPYFVPESKRIIDILKEMQKQRIQIAIVIDEYGGFAGIITMEDIIEEIVGDIQDEFDSTQEPIKKLTENQYSIDARLDLEEINTYFSLSLNDQNADTLGGFVINLFGEVPKINQKIDFKGISFKILSKRRNSIIRIRMTILSK